MFHLSHELVDLFAVHEWDEFTTQSAITMFPAEAAAVLAHEKRGFFCHLAEELAVVGLLDIKYGAQMEFSGADMAIVNAFESEALHHLLEFVKVLRQSLRGDSGIFYHADRFVVAFDTGEHTEACFAKSPYTADVVAIDSAAVIGEALLKELLFESIGVLLHVVAVEFGDKECGGFTLDEETVAVLCAVVATEFKYFAVHEFNGYGVVAQGDKVCLVAKGQ